MWDEYFEVIIADPETDEPLPIGSVGEILVRPKEPFCFMQGYNGMPERTVETWRNFWFHTGDAGRMDERGFLWYIDRIKDTIRRRGENISSYEVEAVLLEYPALPEVAAVAVKADEGGEDEVLACLVLKAGAARPSRERAGLLCGAHAVLRGAALYRGTWTRFPKPRRRKSRRTSCASGAERRHLGPRVSGVPRQTALSRGQRVVCLLRAAKYRRAHLVSSQRDIGKAKIAE